MILRLLRRLTGSSGEPGIRERFAVGDQLTFYRETFRVEAVRRLAEGAERRTQFLLGAPDGRTAVLVVEEDVEEVWSLQRPIEPGEVEPAGEGRVRRAGREFRMTHRGTAQGDRGDCPYREYEDEEEIELLVFEQHGDGLEVRSGTYLLPGEIQLSSS